MSSSPWRPAWNESPVTQALLSLPSRVRPGEIVEVRALIAHPMETGLRTADAGGRVPRHIIEQFHCTYNGVDVCRIELFIAITANPYLAFHLRARDSGLVECTWTDDRGARQSASARLTVG
jgi:sulfur-oxidizing protein SoxZ